MQGETSIPQKEANGKPESFVLTAKSEPKSEQHHQFGTNNTSTTADSITEVAASAETLDELAQKLSALSTGPDTGVDTSGEEEEQEPVDATKYLSLLNKNPNVESSSSPASTVKSPEAYNSGSASVEGNLPTAFADFDEENLSGTEYFATVSPSISPEPWDYTNSHDHYQLEDGDKEIFIDLLNSIQSINGSDSDKLSILDPDDYQHIFDDEKYLEEVVEEVNIVTGTPSELDPSPVDLIEAFDTLDLQAKNSNNPTSSTLSNKKHSEEVLEIETFKKRKPVKKKIRRTLLEVPQPEDAQFLFCQPCGDNTEEISDILENNARLAEEEYLSGFDFDPVIFEELLKYIEEQEDSQLLDTPQDYFGIDTGRCIEIPSIETIEENTVLPDEIATEEDNVLPDEITADEDKQSPYIPLLKGHDTGLCIEIPPGNPIYLEKTKVNTAMDDTFNTTRTQQEEDLQSHPRGEKDKEQESEEIGGSPAILHARRLKDAFENKNERQCLGHQSQVFALSISECGKYCATASQDSSVIVWDVEKNSQLSKIRGSPDHECLRVAWASSQWGTGIVAEGGDGGNGFSRPPGSLVFATSGADGVATIWQSLNGARKWDKLGTFNHGNFDADKNGKSKSSDKDTNGEINNQDEGTDQMNEEKKDGTEVYALQFIDRWLGLPTLPSHENPPDSIGVFMTSSDDFIHIWQHCPQSHPVSDSISACSESFEKVMDIKFTHLEHGYGGVFVHLSSNNDYPDWTKTGGSNIVTNAPRFGGERNPDNLIFVFDAAQCPANNLLGVALSDGTLRLVNGRGICVTILQLPGCQSHLTSFAWDDSGSRLASCVATGHVVLWDIDFGDGKGNVHPVCRSVLEGGHDSGRPLFGASFFTGKDEVSLQRPN